MNRLCRYIEDIDFDVKRKVRSSEDFDYNVLMNQDCDFSNVTYELILQKLKEIYKIKSKTHKEQNTKKIRTDGHQINEDVIVENKVQNIYNDDAIIYLLSTYTNNICELTNYLVKIFYEEQKSWGKNILWNLVGEQMYKNCLRNCNGIIKVPIKSKHGEIRFWNDTFTVIQMNLNEENNNDKNI